MDAKTDMTRLASKSGIQSGSLIALGRPVLFIIKNLLYPISIVSLLAGSFMYWQRPLSGVFLLMMVVVFFASIHFMDGVCIYRVENRFPWLRSFLDILLRWLLMLMVLWFIFELSGFGYLVFEPGIQVWGVVTPFALFLIQITVLLLLGFFLKHKSGKRKAVIVGLDVLGLQLVKNSRMDRFSDLDFLGFFENRSLDRVFVPDGEKILGTIKMLPEFVRRNGVHVVFITLPMANQPRIIELLDAMRDSTASIYFVPDLFIADLIQARFDQVCNVPVVAVCETPFYGLRSLQKRLSDIVIALLLMIPLIPVFILIAMGIKLSSPGAVLFKQRRYGLNGEEIWVYKFRSMTVSENSGVIEQAKRNDARITRFGGFLRRTSLDELPQFINVLQGRMSIVGPRPHAVSHNELYRQLIKGYMIRHKVKPGITGWAQINGFRGETDSLDKMAARIEYDLDYLRNWSFGLDLQIILRTVGVLLGDKNAY